MDQFVESVYDTLQGSLLTPVPGVEDLFAAGKPCARWYREMLAAYGRLCDRLGVPDEDPDIETIINSLLSIQRELCGKMYEYGTKFVCK